MSNQLGVPAGSSMSSNGVTELQLAIKDNLESIHSKYGPKFIAWSGNINDLSEERLLQPPTAEELASTCFAPPNHLGQLISTYLRRPISPRPEKRVRFIDKPTNIVIIESDKASDKEIKETKLANWLIQADPVLEYKIILERAEILYQRVDNGANARWLRDRYKAIGKRDDELGRMVRDCKIRDRWERIEAGHTYFDSPQREE